MACLFPVRIFKKNLGNRRNNDSIALRPCGQCKKCRLESSKEWAVRIYHESLLYEKNCFLALTYNDENLPKDGSIHKKEVVAFIKKLRKKLHPKKIRFYACGEYGDNGFRPHYHAIIFGYQFDDLEELFFDKKGCYWVYTSKTLSGVWDKGFHTITEVTMGSCMYIARYVRKKITGTSEHALKAEKQRYNGKTKEFALMSKGFSAEGGNGIGKQWLLLNYKDVYPKDFVTINGNKYKPPRYYDTIYAKMFPVKFQEIREKREKNKKLEVPGEWEQLNKYKYYEAMTKAHDRKDI